MGLFFRKIWVILLLLSKNNFDQVPGFDFMVSRKRIAEDFVNSIKSDNIDKIILFGSVARNEDTDDSDIDILIVADDYFEIEPQITEGIYNAIKDYGELISAHVMTRKTFNKTKNYSFLSRVLEEGIPLV